MQHLNYQCKYSDDHVLATYNNDNCYASLEVFEYMLLMGAAEIIVRLSSLAYKILDGIHDIVSPIFIFTQGYLFHNALLLNHMERVATAKEGTNTLQEQLRDKEEKEHNEEEK